LILKSLSVENIRSIKKLENLDFPESTILFYGDIGSGKSSILKAIEFALFGILTSSNLSGESLLRRGQKKAVAELTFLIDSDEYQIHRELSKSVSKGEAIVRQEEGWLKKNGTKTTYSPIELRKKVLELLNYSVARYKRKHSIDIFRYTVYTPQEKIKEILLAEPDERFEILKDVLEIEKYEKALENLGVIRPYLSRKCRDIERDIKSIGTPEDELSQIKELIKEKKEEINKKETIIQSKKDILEEIKKDLKKKQKQFTQYTKKITEITEKEKQVQEDKEEIKESKAQLSALKKEIEQKQTKLKNLPEIKKKTEKTKETLEKELTSLNESINQAENKKGAVKRDIENIQELLEEGKCSVCGQSIHEKERFTTELSDAKQKLAELENNINSFNEKVKNVKALQKNIEQYQEFQQQKQNLQNLIQEKKKRENDITSQITALHDKVKKNQNDITRVMESYNIDDLKSFKSLGVKLKKKVEKEESNERKVQSDLTDLEKEHSTLETELKTMEKEQQELKKDIKTKKRMKEQLEYILSVKDWIVNKFPVCLKDIERTILSTTASNFNKYFKDWFKILVEEENIDIRINPENFQPIVNVNGYQSPFEELSGGEKSALSLAYRLALNKVIISKYEKAKTNDLLILDEPTDGFSQKQVNKMQDIFNRLDIKQMIIISHERTLDSFVTHIYDFEKVNHKTQIKPEKL